MPNTDLNAKVLVVDSDPVQLKRIVDHLTTLSFYQPTPCASICDAKALFTGASLVDIVVCSMMLNDGTSFDLLSEIEPLEPAPPVIFMSAAGAERDAVEALRRGVANYVLTPIDDLDVLVLAIDKALEHSRLAQAHQQSLVELASVNQTLRQHVRVLERDQAAGRVVQQKFLPHTPALLGGVDVSYRILPSLYLSGDAVDYCLLGDRYLAFYLTDIAGHGAASAFVAVWVRQLVRSCFREQRLFQSRASFEMDAPSLMSRINGELVKSGIGPHLTCFVGVIDTLTLEMNYIVGGHLPLPILLSQEYSGFLQGSGKPLGLFPNAEWKMQSICLPQEFKLAVFSDGIFDATERRGIIEQEKVIEEKLVASQPESLEAVMHALGIDEKREFPDDVTMLMLRHNRGSGRVSTNDA